MFSRFKAYTIARSSIFLVFLVMAICLGQRAGFTSVCSFSLDTDTFDSLQPDNPADSLSKSSCELGNQMLHIQLQFLESLWLALIPVIVLMLAWLSSGQQIFQAFTEPIPPSRRQHLILCVFKE